MREYLNEDTLFATIAMYLSESDALVLVVEGDDDHLTLKDHCSPDLRLIPGTGGKLQILKTAELARKRALPRVRFLVDRDYDSYSDEPVEFLENVFVSETHDFFVDIITSDTNLLSRLIDVHTASARRRPTKGARIPASEKIRQDAFALASLLAATRIVDRRRRLCLDFKRFSFANLKANEADPRTVAEKVLSRTLHEEDSVPEILEEVERTHEEIQLLPQPPIGDHDFFAALASVLKRFNITVRRDELQRGFILSITCNSLAGTRWFHDIQKWCAAVDRTGFNCESRVTLAA